MKYLKIVLAIAVRVITVVPLGLLSLSLSWGAEKTEGAVRWLHLKLPHAARDYGFRGLD